MIKSSDLRFYNVFFPPSSGVTKCCGPTLTSEPVLELLNTSRLTASFARISLRLHRMASCSITCVWLFPWSPSRSWGLPYNKQHTVVPWKCIRRYFDFYFWLFSVLRLLAYQRNIKSLCIMFNFFKISDWLSKSIILKNKVVRRKAGSLKLAIDHCLKFELSKVLFRNRSIFCFPCHCYQCQCSAVCRHPYPCDTDISVVFVAYHDIDYFLFSQCCPLSSLLLFSKNFCWCQFPNFLCYEFFVSLLLTIKVSILTAKCPVGQRWTLISDISQGSVLGPFPFCLDVDCHSSIYVNSGIVEYRPTVFEFAFCS